MVSTVSLSIFYPLICPHRLSTRLPSIPEKTSLHSKPSAQALVNAMNKTTGSKAEARDTWGVTAECKQQERPGQRSQHPAWCLLAEDTEAKAGFVARGPGTKQDPEF